MQLLAGIVFQATIGRNVHGDKSFIPMSRRTPIARGDCPDIGMVPVAISWIFPPIVLIGRKVSNPGL